MKTKISKRFNKIVKKPIILAISNNRKFWLFSSLAKLSRSYLKVYENNNNDHITNGEARVLSILSKLQPNVIFYVGANVGDWASIALKETTNCKVLSFEPIKPTYSELENRIKNDENIFPYNIGLSNKNGCVDLYYKPGHSLFSSEITFEYDKSVLEVHKIQVERGEDFCNNHHIDVIDLLKIDVEGAEPKVLEGFQSMLKAGCIKSIQFEYGRFNIISKFLLKDFYDFLEPLGFKIGKVYPKGVEFRPYDKSMEDFLGLNYLAVHDSVSAAWIPKLK
jgi:FkbM family methyltransferase